MLNSFTLELQIFFIPLEVKTEKKKKKKKKSGPLREQKIREILLSTF